MERYSISDLLDDTTSEDRFKEILENIWSIMHNYILNKDIPDLDNYYINNPFLDELSECESRLYKIVPEDLFQDLKKRKIYAVISLFNLLSVYEIIKLEIGFKKKNLELLKHKYTKDFIYFLNDKDVVTKAEICEHLKISKSTLNRFLAKIKPYNLYSVKKYGKGINYYYCVHKTVHLFKIISKMEKISVMFQQFK